MTRPPVKTLIFGVAISLLAAVPAFADLHLTMRDGRVSIVAKDATIRQILIEWARVGQTKIVNVERVPGGPVTLELNNVMEIQALDVLLRSLSGYIAARRPVDDAKLSRFDRIIIMPTVAASRPEVSASSVSASAVPASSPLPPPMFQQAPPLPQPSVDAQDGEPAVTNVEAPPDTIRGPAANTFQKGLEVGRPAMPQGQPQTPVTQTTSPRTPLGGVAVPGMIAPLPLQPGQPPGQPVRRPGGP